MQNEIVEQQINWMKKVADKLSDGIVQQTPLVEVIEELKETYKENYGIF